MRLGARKSDRVFLLSTTHGAETYGLAAAIATMNVYQREPVIETLWAGQRLADGLRAAAKTNGVADHIPILGPALPRVRFAA